MVFHNHRRASNRCNQPSSPKGAIAPVSGISANSELFSPLNWLEFLSRWLATFAFANRIRKPGKQEGRRTVLEQDALTERIIRAAIEVHRRLGLGFLESVSNIHLAAARSYLRAAGRKDGLLLNFAETMLEAERAIAF